MTDADVITETPILAQLGSLRSPMESRLLRWAVWLVLTPFGLNLALDGMAALRFGVPQGETRFILASLFDPVYQTFFATLLVIALLLQVFFRHVPYTFQRLAEQQVIDEKEKGSALVFVLTYRRWLDHPARILAGIAFAAVALAVDYYIVFGSDPARMLPGREPASVGAYAGFVWVTNWINSLGFLLILYVGGLLTFKMVVTAVLIYHMPVFFEFDIQPSHPDKCGGFKAIGDLCLKMAYILVAMALFVGFWLFVSRDATLGPELRALLPAYLLSPGFRTPANLLLALLAVSGLAVFFWPMVTIHNLMLEARSKLQKNLDLIARRIHQLDRATLADPTRLSVDDRKKNLTEIDSLKDLYERTYKAPTWPFERSVAIKFASSQALPLLSLIGVGAGPLNQLAQIVIALVQGG